MTDEQKTLLLQRCIDDIDRAMQDIDRTAMLIPIQSLSEYPQTLLNLFQVKLSHLRTKNWNKFKKVAKYG